MKDAKQSMIDEISDRIRDLGEEIRYNKDLSMEDKMTQMDILLDTIKFLKDYDENVKILNKHRIEHKWERT